MRLGHILAARGSREVSTERDEALEREDPMKTARTVLSNPIPRRVSLSRLLLAAAALLPAAAFAGPYDDVSYGDIPAATFGSEEVATPAADDGAIARDDVTYGPHASFALELPSRDALPLAGHDDMTYPAAAPRPDEAAALARSDVREGSEVRASSEARDGAATKIRVDGGSASDVGGR
jgi:hypothetical protein